MDTDKILNDIYYQPSNMCSNKRAITELHKKTKIDKDIIENWLDNKEIYQIHKPRPKKIVRPMYRVIIIL